MQVPAFRKYAGLKRRLSGPGRPRRTYYDGTWSIRLTPGHPSRRLNSVNPLDPNDHSELNDRIARAKRVFAAAGKPLTFGIRRSLRVNW